MRPKCFRVAPVAFVAAGAVLASCSDGNDAPTRAGTAASSAPCLWETSELLSRVEVPAPEPLDCGVFLGQPPLDNDCFAGALAAGDAVQITINNCIDCMVHSTYVSVPSVGKFHLYREADYYGDNTRVVRIDSCTDFVAGEGSGANCAQPEVLYACSDPLPAPSGV